MPGLQKAFTRGLMVGAAGATVWALSRRGKDAAQPALLDWGWSSRVAERVSRSGGLLDAQEKARLLAGYRALVQRVERPLQEYTGTILPLGETTVEVMDRADWIRANVVNFRDLFEPVEEAYARSVAEGGASALALSALTRIIVSGQFGLLLGSLAW